MTSKFIQAAEICQELSICRRTLDRWIADGRFPAPLRFGRKHVWLRQEFETRVEQVAAERQPAK